MASEPQSRKYLVTINNPVEHGYSGEMIETILASIGPTYYCTAEEIATTGTHHVHVFVYRKSPIRFRTMQKHFPGAHIDMALGSCAENRDYVSKSGKWENDPKTDTSIPDTFFESGVMPLEAEETDPAGNDIISQVEQGETTATIIKNNPKLWAKTNRIDELRSTLAAEKYMEAQRDVTIFYLYGPTGTGKTKSIFEKYPAKDICRITSYGSGNNSVRFDSYQQQPVMVFEEFHSQIPIASMLNYLDRYPLMLPARYADRVACFTTVYITSNLPLNEQYKNIQFFSKDTWLAFLRRIDRVIEFRSDGTTIEHSIDEYR